MKEEKIRGVKFNVFVSVVSVLAVSIFVTFIFDFSFPGLSSEIKQRLNQAGGFMNIFAALFLSYKFIHSERYKVRELVLYKKDEELETKLSYEKYNIYDEDTLRDVLSVLEAKREDLYTELNNIMALDKLDKVHVLMGLTCVAIGSCLQIVGAG